MKPELLVAVLTVLSAVVVVLTRVRLCASGAVARSEVWSAQVTQAGPAHMGKAAVNAHTACGVLALALWVPFLATGHDSSLVGVLGLFFYWLTAVVGLLLLWRWKPAHGRHAASTPDPSWSDGPGLSLLTHVGMVVGVLVFTWYYGTQS